LPAQYSLLSAEPTLLTGRHTVIGKVMRRLEPADPENAAFSDSKYTDVATIASFRPALRALPKFWVTLRARAARESLEETRRRLDVDEDDPGYRASVREFRRSPLRARARLQKQLAALTTITAPGLVILPIAIYK
jgi:hypothetical protein